jgi:hypothetical protein
MVSVPQYKARDINVHFITNHSSISLLISNSEGVEVKISGYRGLDGPQGLSENCGREYNNSKSY